MKVFFTYEQQIEKLKSDGLIIVDEYQAIEELKTEGYYNLINGYSPIFKNDNRFIKGTSFDHINNLYDFDRSLRSIVYKYASVIECHFKALLAHEFSAIHGVDEKVYLTPDNFSSNKNSKENVIKLIEKCNKTIQDALSKNTNKYREYIAHNYNEHHHVPMWILVRALTFGTTSIFYANLIDNEKEVIAKQYHLSAGQLKNILEIVVAFRNIVAHGERTFCAKLPKTRLPSNLKIVKSLSIPKNKKGYHRFGSNDFLALMICFKYLLSSIEFAGFITELNAAFDILSQQPLNILGQIKTQMGLKSNNWKILPKLKTE